ncbi:MAG: hypothetical protein ABSF67_19360 [Roseiarcus sp.]|jgi:hypothetical protein
MRYRFDEKRLPSAVFASPSESLEGQFGGLSAGIDELPAQFGMRIVAAEEALAVVQATRNLERIAIERIAICAAQRS